MILQSRLIIIFKLIVPQVVELDAGDILYIPPYTFHYVTTLETSVSMTSWSHNMTVKQLREHMNMDFSNK